MHTRSWVAAPSLLRTAFPRSSTTRNASTSSRRPGSTWGASKECHGSGSYFTREMQFLNTSIIIVRGKDDVIRAFHNVCPHRGNKMLWSDDPFEEVQGRAPLLYCRFHGWRYNLDGSLHSATREDLLLDFDADSCRVPAIQCEVWEGFIFINLNPDNTESVRDFLGDLGKGTRGLSLRRAAPGIPIQGRVAVQLEDLRRWLRGELSRPVSARIVLRHPHGGGQGGAEQAQSLHRRVVPPAQGSAPDVLVRRRALAENSVLQAHRVCDGGQRSRTLDQGRSWTHAAGNQPHPSRRSTASTPTSSSRTS